MKKDLEQRCCKLAKQMGWTVSLQSDDEPYPPSSYIFEKNYCTLFVTFTNPNNQSTKTQAKKRKQSEFEDYFTVTYCVSDFDTFRRILIEKKDYKGPGMLLIDPVC